MAARMYDTGLDNQAGIMRLNNKNISANCLPLWGKKEEIMIGLRVLDEQNAITRYTWYNQPLNLTSQEIERLLYYKYQLYLFYYEPLDQFFLMPGALDGGIDFYGRPETIHPVPIADGLSKEALEAQTALLSTLRLKVYYDIPTTPLTYEEMVHACVPIYDYSHQLSQTSGKARYVLQDPILDVMSECVPLMRTSLKNSTGAMTMTVQNEDEASNVNAANKAMDTAAIEGYRYVPIVSKTGLNPEILAPNTPARSEEFLMAMQGLDNYRLSLLGLSNGGLFQKKSHMLESEQNMNAGNAKAALDDGIAIRQHACDVATIIWGIGMSCEISETALGADRNGDGLATEDRDQSGMPGDQPDTNATTTTAEED